MKIVIVNRHPADFIGGSELQCVNLAEELDKRGHEIIYVAVDGRIGHDYKEPYKVVAVEQNARAITQATVNAMPDIVYWRMNKYHFYSFVKTIKVKHNIPIIFGISHINDTVRFSHYFAGKNDIVSRLKAIKHGITNALNFRGYRYVDAVTCLNKDFMGLIPVKRQEMIMDCIDIRQQAFSWPKPFVVWVATIKASKRPDLFLNLAKEINIQGIDFLMVGPVMDEDYRWLSQDGLSSNFHYLGPKSIEQVNGIIQKSLFLVHTCLPEGYGNNFMQAWFCGKPTLSLGFDPENNIANNGLGASSKESWDDFVGRTRDFIKDAHLRESAGIRAKQFYEATFSTERTVDKLVDLMHEVVSVSRK